MNKTVDELAAQAGRMLADLGYEPVAIRRYTTTWNKLKKWCSECGIEWFGAGSSSWSSEQHRYCR